MPSQIYETLSHMMIYRESRVLRKKQKELRDEYLTWRWDNFRRDATLPLEFRRKATQYCTQEQMCEWYNTADRADNQRQSRATSEIRGDTGMRNRRRSFLSGRSYHELLHRNQMDFHELRRQLEMSQEAQADRLRQLRALRNSPEGRQARDNMLARLREAVGAMELSPDSTALDHDEVIKLNCCVCGSEFKSSIANLVDDDNKLIGCCSDACYDKIIKETADD